jgi:DNA-binding transcriptional regulator YhcF (GntR family)
MDCAAYKDLNANARAIYEQIKRRYNGSNNGFIVYSVRQAADELKISKATAARAFNQLEDHWFIVAEQRGHFSWKINPNGSKIRPANHLR